MQSRPIRERGDGHGPIRSPGPRADEGASVPPSLLLSWIAAARRVCPTLLAMSALGPVLFGCAPLPAPPATSVPTATARPLPTSTAPPPPRPTAAPPALSPASSPVAVASPRAAIAAPRLPFRVRAAQLGALSDSGQAVGMARGYFAEQGLDLQLVPFSSPSSALAALSAGQLEAASVPITAELFNALGRGSGLKIVAEAAGAPPGHAAAGLIVRSDLVGAVRTPTDLRNFRVALPARGGNLEVELAALLKQGWLARTDVETIIMPPVEVTAALADGSLDAAMIAEPELSEMENDGLGRVWRRSDRIVPNHLMAALLFTTRFGTAQPDAARRYVTAYLRALRLYNDAFIKADSTARNELVQILSRSTPISEPAQFDRIALPGMNPNGMVNVQTLRLDQQYFLATGQQQKEVDLAAVVDAQYAAYAISQLGEYR